MPRCEPISRRMKYYLESVSGESCWKWNVVFVLLVILDNAAISTIEASSFRERHICGLVQCKEPKKFHYKAGTVYSYDYTVNVTTSIEGGPGEESGLHMSSAIAIKFLTGCEAVLSMGEVHVWESHIPSNSVSENHHFSRLDSDETFSKGLQQFPLRFSYIDGVIEEICPNPKESILMLNVKRGLLSSLQNTMRRLDLEHKGEEDDIHGRCKTEYRLGMATASNLTIERTKDIGSCGDKFGILSSVQGTPYHFGTLHQSMPAVSSTSECEHVVDRNLISSVQCFEVHKLQSLSRGTGAAQTRIHQQLDLTSVHDPSKVEGSRNEDEGIPTVSDFLDPMFAHLIPMVQTDVVRRETLQFKHDYHIPPNPNDRTTAQGALRAFCAALKDGVEKSAGDSFETLVSVLRGLESTDMMSLSDEATNICQGDRTPFDDALEAVGTAASVHVIKEQILKRNGSSAATVRSWIDSLTYIPRPSLALMEEAVDILKERGNYPQILLSFSTLAHSYCKTNSNCSAHRPIDILSRLYKKFFAHTGCVARHGRDVEQILMYLRGIGNFGVYSLGVRDAVARCIQRNDRDRTEIRVAAIEAYRRMGCNPEIDLVKNIFKNPDEDSEVRIAAFVSIMRCPNYETIKWIRKLLEVEEVNQVGSFVVSYLRNLQETALPSKAELQGLVSDENFSKKFSADFRKFSRSFEVSTFYDDFNFGVGLESNLIFSQKSYLPRSTSLNLTVDLFGESINIFEATVRLENFEHYIESLFGPNGKFRNKELYSIVSSFREKRATPNKRRLKQLAVEFDAMRRYNLDPTASLSLKTFGNEILFKRSVGVANNSDFIEALNPFEWVKSLAKQNSNFQKSKMFLDSTYIIPTGMGLPLNLTAQASVLIKMDSETEFISEISEFKVKGKLKPSAILAVTGSMIFGTANFQTGIKIKAHLRSSTAVDGTFHIRGTELLQAEFGLPQTQLDLLEYKSELLFVQGRIARIVGEHPQKPLVCSGGFFQEMFGLKLCRSFHFNLSPNSEVDDLSSPYFPLNGPAFFNVVLEKADPSLLSTKVTYMWLKNETNTKLEATHGIKSAQQTMSYGITYDMDRINQNLALGISLPGKKLTVTGMLERDGSGGKVDVTAVSNNVQLLAAMISFVKTGAGNGKALLEPEILIKLYNSRILNGNATLHLEQTEGGLEFGGNGLLSFESSSPVHIRLNGSSNASRLQLVEWEVIYNGGSEGTSTSMQKVQWKSEIRKEAWGRDDEVKDTIDTNLSLSFSQFPDYNLEASWKYQRGDETLTSEGEFNLGTGLDRSSVQLRLDTRESYGLKDMIWLFEVTQPVHQSQWGVEGSFNAAGNSLNSTIKVQYAPGKKIQGSLALERAPAGALALFGVGVTVQIPNQHPLTVGAHFRETAPRTYDGRVGGNWFGRASLSTEVSLVDRTRRQKLDKDLGLRIEFGRTLPEELLNLRCHIYSDDKESKVTFSSQHQRKNYSWELGHALINKGSKRHRLYSSVQAGEQPNYSVTIESGIDDRGLELSFETKFNAKFSDIYTGILVTKDVIGLDYKWDASRDASKSFAFLLLFDSSQIHYSKVKLDLESLKKYFDDSQRNKITSSTRNHEVDLTKSVIGRINWPSGQIGLSGHLKKIPGRSLTYDLSGDLSTPFDNIRNTSLKARFNCVDAESDCVTSIDVLWGLKGRVSGVISSHYEVLPASPEALPEQIGSDEDEADDIDEEEGEEGNEFSRRRRGVVGDSGKTKGFDDMSPRPRLQPEPGYKFRFNSNLTTTFKGWEALAINMQHTHNDLFHLKTDIDMQLPGQRELSISNQWYIPKTVKEIWSTRVHLQAKTPFPNYESFDLQAVVGHQEDSDKLATFGIYTDQSQYSLTITGTPRLDKEDGSLGFDLVTPLPNYDKIFGSLSYSIGESSRLACQLGWPKVLIGLETGFEWTGSWDEFQTFLTLNSPWEPLQNINTLAKIDTSQAEFKFLVNDQGVTAKSEWVVETLDNFDLRLDATSPFPTWRRLGFIAKHSLDGTDEFYSHIFGWVNEVEVGYKWEGSKSELEDDDVEGAVMKCQLEIDTVVYPTIRVSSSLVRRESKYSADASLLLREGPINLSVELNLLGPFRFNEKVRITSPYAALYEFEINLRPAIIPENDLYNFGFDCKWRSDEEQEVALVIRRGNQAALSDALTQDLEDEAEVVDEEEDEVHKERSKVIVPMSQLFHFSTPWKWTKTIKFEVEEVNPSNPQDVTGRERSSEDEEDEEEDGERRGSVSVPQFPWKTIVVLFDSDFAELSFNVQNEILRKSLSAGLSLPEIQSPLSLKFQSKLDMESSEKKLSVNAISHWPELEEIHLMSSYEERTDYLNTRVDLQTSFPSWEGQHASLMYACSRSNSMDTLDLELSSDEYGKLATNIVRGPLSVGIVLNTPFEGYKAIDFEAASALRVDSDENIYETTISTTIDDEEIFKVEAESTMENNFPKMVNGTIRTTLEEEQGNFGVLMRGTPDELNANGQIHWRNEKVSFGLRLSRLQQTMEFTALDLKVTTPFKGYENWKLGLKKLKDVEDEDEDDHDEDVNEEDYDAKEIESESVNFLLNADTPWSQFSPFKGKVTIRMAAQSPLAISGFRVSGACPNANMDLKTFWTLSSWNRFEIQSDSKYSHTLDIYSLSSIPTSNFFKFKIRNFIPNFEVFEKVDSSIYYETLVPQIRLGSSALVNIQNGNTPNARRLTINLTSTLPTIAHSLHLNSNFDAGLRSVTSKMTLTALPSTEVATSTLEVERRKNSLNGKLDFEWGDTSAQSKFNCTYSPATLGLERLQAEVFVPTAQNPQETIGSIDATFQNNPHRHNIRIQGKRIGAHKPLLVDLHLSGHWTEPEAKYANLMLSVESPYDDIPSSKIYIQGKHHDGIHGKFGGNIGARNGSFESHWWVQEPVAGSVQVNGSVELNVELGQFESGKAEYYSLVKQSDVTGLFKMILNNVEHIDSTYKYQTRGGARDRHDVSQFRFGNQFWPFGVTTRYLHEYAGTPNVYPETTVQLVEVFDLVHSDLHKLGGELRTVRTFNGREITLTGLHPLRNVSISTKYEIAAGEFRQNVSFSWAQGSLLGYEIRLQDLSVERKLEQKMELRVHYPARVIRFSSGYVLEKPSGSGQVWTELDLNATNTDQRGLKGIVNWDIEQNSVNTIRKVSAIIKHPLLPQDVRGGGELRVTSGNAVEGKFSLDYSGDPKRRLTFGVKAIPRLEGSYFWNLTSDLRLQHAVTNLDLKAFHSNRHLPHELSIITLIDFKNSGKLSRESKITFELFKQLKKLQLMLANPDEQFDLTCQIQDRDGIFHFVADTNITGYNPSPKVEMTLDKNQPYIRFNAVHGKDGSKGLHGEGGVLDSRNVKFDIFESYDNFRFSDVNFFLRMNHSRLVTSKLIWRPELLNELQASYVNRIEDLKEIWSHQTDKLLLSLWTDSAQIYNQVWENAKTTIEPFIEEIREQADFGKDAEALSDYFDNALDQNDFYLDDMMGLAQIFADQVSVRFSNVFINLREYRAQILGETSMTEHFENCLLWILEKAQDQYRTITKMWETYRPRSSDFASTITFPFPHLGEILSEAAYQVVEFGIGICEAVSDQFSDWMSSAGPLFHELLNKHRPTIAAFVHRMEVWLYQMLLGFSDFIYETRDEVVKSTYYQNLAQLAQDIDQLYRDLLQEDFSANTSKYHAMFINFIQKKTNFDQLKKYFEKICEQVESLWSEFQELSIIKDLRRSIDEFSTTIQTVAEYTRIGEFMRHVSLRLYEKGPELMRQTVLEANAKYEQAKTKFIFDADKGIVDWEQKLPMPWSAFNVPPRFTELPEYQGVLKLKELFQSSSSSVFDAVYQSRNGESMSWYPPFDGHALVADSNHFFTFDGKSYNFSSGSSVYLLAGDLVEGNFSISIDYREVSDRLSKANIIVTSGHNTLIIDFGTKSLRDPKRPQNVGLPIQMHYLQGYRNGETLTVQSTKGEFSVDCNVVYGLCQLNIAGWHSRKVGGLLGTMDHEPRTDMIYSNGKVAQDVVAMARSWDVSDDVHANASFPPVRSQPNPGIEPLEDASVVTKCQKFFSNPLSSLQPCFNFVDVRPYVDMCSTGSETSDTQVTCLAAMTYLRVCQLHGVEVQMPSVCIKCDLNGETMIDRDIKVMDLMESSARSADIVFIVEAKDCNKNAFSKRRLDTLVNIMEQEFKKSKIINNRYAIVTFGGDGVFERPHSIVVRGELFTAFDKLADHFKSVHTSFVGGGSRDTFSAIAHALNLGFRPAVTKILILLPCTSCQLADMKTDFSTVQYGILEQAASLHILLHKELEFEDKGMGKKFFGMDNAVAFTKSDGVKAGPLIGNRILRAHVKIPKRVLGHCASLALQTNGTIFSGKKLQQKRDPIVNSFSRVFSRRLVKAAEPIPCHSCYCIATEDGIGQVKCLRCDSQIPNLYNQETYRDFVEAEDGNDRIDMTTLPPRIGPIENEDEEVEEDGEDSIDDDYEEYPDGADFG